jgi:hypothetical protein
MNLLSFTDSAHFIRLQKEEILRVHQNGIMDDHNKRWHFVIESKTPDETNAILEQWYRSRQNR